MHLGFASLFVWVLENLDATRFVLLTYTTKESFSIMHDCDLRQNNTLLVPERFLTLSGGTFTQLPNRLI
jgi:hypothetical protein